MSPVQSQWATCLAAISKMLLGQSRQHVVASRESAQNEATLRSIETAELLLKSQANIPFQALPLFNKAGMNARAGQIWTIHATNTRTCAQAKIQANLRARSLDAQTPMQLRS